MLDAPIFHRQEFLSLNRPGTFGGLWPRCSADEAMKQYAETMPSKVSLPPMSHDPEFVSAQVNALARLGYALIPELNQDLVIDHHPLAIQMEHGNAKKLAKCRREGVSVSTIPRAQWESAHSLLVRNRAERGRALSLSWDDLTRQEEALPGCFRFYRAQVRDETAVSICVRISPRVFYIFAWGDSGKSEWAPTVPLAAHIYECAQKEGYSILDAGISTENGVPNEGLMRFKASLGFKTCLKPVMVRR